MSGDAKPKWIRHFLTWEKSNHFGSSRDSLNRQENLVLYIDRVLNTTDTEEARTIYNVIALVLTGIKVPLIESINEYRQVLNRSRLRYATDTYHKLRNDYLMAGNVIVDGMPETGIDIQDKVLAILAYNKCFLRGKPLTDESYASYTRFISYLNAALPDSTYPEMEPVADIDSFNNAIRDEALKRYESWLAHSKKSGEADLPRDAFITWLLDKESIHGGGRIIANLDFTKEAYAHCVRVVDALRKQGAIEITQIGEQAFAKTLEMNHKNGRQR